MLAKILIWVFVAVCLLGVGYFEQKRAEARLSGMAREIRERGHGK